MNSKNGHTILTIRVKWEYSNTILTILRMKSEKDNSILIISSLGPPQLKKALKFPRPLPSYSKKGPTDDNVGILYLISTPLPYFGKKPNFINFVNWGGPLGI